MKKRIVALVSIVVLLVSIFAFMVPANAYYCVYSHCKNGKALNVRKAPTKNSAILYKIPYGDEIWVVGKAKNGFLKLNDGGYVQASLTCSYKPGRYKASTTKTTTKKKSTLETTIASAKIVTPYMITLKATARSKGVANVRWQPIKSAKLMKSYAPGTQLKVLAEMKNWYQVQDPVTQAVGYVNVAYVVK